MKIKPKKKNASPRTVVKKGKNRSGKVLDPVEARGRKALGTIGREASKDPKLVLFIRDEFRRAGAPKTVQQIRFYLDVHISGSSMMPSYGAGLMLVQFAEEYRTLTPKERLERKHQDEIDRI